MIALAVALAAAQPTGPLPAPAPPATTPAPVDPARLTVAERVVLSLVPPGTYARIMREQLPQVIDVVMGQLGGMAAPDPTASAGAGANAVPDATLADAIAARDPAFRERLAITNRVMADELGKVMSIIEPRLRAGLARAFARKFSVGQLTDMNVFFATPSGSAFAREYLAAFVDPDVMREMLGALPEWIEAMPAIGAKVEAATAHLPKPVPTLTEEASDD